MNYKELASAIRQKKSCLCVGLDTDITKIPAHLRKLPDPVFAFNQAIINATQKYAVAYKINTAFYEAQGLRGWESLQRTLEYIPSSCFTIADAKRGDIGNTSTQYAKAFFDAYPFNSITIAPYMGEDSVSPFLQFKDKWAIVLGLTSNAGSKDFQMLKVGDQFLYEKVITTCASWGSHENMMFVVGATQTEELANIRKLIPQHFLLVPGVGAQGGSLEEVMKIGANENIGLLINVSRDIIFAQLDENFATAAAEKAQQYQQKMEPFII